MKKSTLLSSTYSVPVGPLEPVAAVPLAHAKSNPVVMGVGFNTAMQRWDLTLTIGNFETEQDAREAVGILAGLVERELGVVQLANHKAKLS